MNEYCVMHRSYPNEPHRGPWSLSECRQWVKEAEEDDGIAPGVFYVSIRYVSPWRAYQGLGGYDG